MPILKAKALILCHYTEEETQGRRWPVRKKWGARPNLLTEGRGHLARVWSISNSLKEGVVTSKAILEEFIEGTVRRGSNRILHQ